MYMRFLHACCHILLWGFAVSAAGMLHTLGMLLDQCPFCAQVHRRACQNLKIVVIGTLISSKINVFGMQYQLS